MNRLSQHGTTHIRRKHHIRRLIMHFDVEVNIAHWRVCVLTLHVFEHLWVMLEVLGRKGLSMMHLEGVEVGKLRVMHLMHLGSEARHSIRLMSDMKSILRSWHR